MKSSPASRSNISQSLIGRQVIRQQKPKRRRDLTLASNSLHLNTKFNSFVLFLTFSLQLLPIWFGFSKEASCLLTNEEGGTNMANSLAISLFSACEYSCLGPKVQNIALNTSQQFLKIFLSGIIVLQKNREKMLMIRWLTSKQISSLWVVSSKTESSNSDKSEATSQPQGLRLTAPSRFCWASIAFVRSYMMEP